jgi:hypothetical protein
MKNITPVSVGIKNIPFAVWRFIKMSPYKTMWVRELVKNSIEATNEYSKTANIKKPIKIKIRGLKVPEITGYNSTNWKFSILNYGGMNRAELLESGKLFSSVNKTQSDQDNFGVGVKVNLSPFTEWMVISYKAKQAHYIMMGVENQQLRIFNDIHHNNCTDWVNAHASARDYDMDHDWTEVVILGKNDPKLNTVKEPYGSAVAKVPGTFYTQKIFERFVDIPEGIQIVFEQGLQKEATPHTNHARGAVKFAPWEKKFEWAKQNTPKCQSESIEGNDGHIYHFYYDALNDEGNTATNGTSLAQGNADFVSLIWGKHLERERYDVRYLDKWKRLSSQLGIYSDHACFKIFVELPFDKYESSTYRDTIKAIGDDDRQTVEMSDFLKGMKETMPDWFKKKVLEHNEKRRPDNIDARIDQWLKDNYPNDPMPGDGQGNGAKTKKNKKNSTSTITPKPKPTPTLTPTPRPKPKVFAPVNILKPKFIADVTLDEFGQYVADGNGGQQDIIYYNPEHEVVDSLFNKVIETIDEELVEAVRFETVELLKTKIGALVVFAKGQASAKKITQETYENVTADQPLTLAARQNADLVDFLKKFAKEKQIEREKLSISPSMEKLKQDLLDANPKNKIPLIS